MTAYYWSDVRILTSSSRVRPVRLRHNQEVRRPRGGPISAATSGPPPVSGSVVLRLDHPGPENLLHLVLGVQVLRLDAQDGPHRVLGVVVGLLRQPVPRTEAVVRKFAEKCVDLSDAPFNLIAILEKKSFY